MLLRGERDGKIKKKNTQTGTRKNESAGRGLGPMVDGGDRGTPPPTTYARHLGRANAVGWRTRTFAYEPSLPRTLPSPSPSPQSSSSSSFRTAAVGIILLLLFVSRSAVHPPTRTPGPDRARHTALTARPTINRYGIDIIVFGYIIEKKRKTIFLLFFRSHSGSA